MSFIANARLQTILLAALAVLLYANTLSHGLVLDDTVVLTHNRWVQEGVKGIPKIFSESTFAGFLPDGSTESPLTGGRYRPLSLMFFAILVQIFGTKGLVFHLFSLLLYALNVALLYRFLRLALQPVLPDAGSAIVAWGATLLFAVHPVHTEVVANVKSCDEQLALLASLGALFCTLQAARRQSWKWGISAGILYLTGCLAKEQAVSVLLLAPVALWVFREKNTSPTPPSGKPAWLPALLPLIPALVVYVVLRGAAIGWDVAGTAMADPLNNPFLKSDGHQWIAFTDTEKMGTIWFTLVQYIRLLVWPHPLTHDYYPFQIGPHSLSEPVVLFAIAVYALLLAAIVWGLFRRSVAAFGLSVYLLPLLVVSNIFLPVGTFMGERFLFTPSVGFCLISALGAYALSRRLPITKVPLLVVTALVAAAFAGLTFLRTPAWADDRTLAQTDVVHSPNSAKLRNTLGTILLTDALQTPDTTARRQLLTDAEANLKQAIQLHPTYYDALLAYGACSFYLGNYDMSIAGYRGAMRMNPEDPKPKMGLSYALRYTGDLYARQPEKAEIALGYMTEAWDLAPDTTVAAHLARYMEQQGQPKLAAEWLEKAVTLAPNDVRLLRALSKAYQDAGDQVKAAEAMKRAESFTSFSPAGTQ